jgi:hypothetical protein
VETKAVAWKSYRPFLAAFTEARGRRTVTTSFFTLHCIAEFHFDVVAHDLTFDLVLRRKVWPFHRFLFAQGTYETVRAHSHCWHCNLSVFALLAEAERRGAPEASWIALCLQTGLEGDVLAHDLAVRFGVAVVFLLSRRFSKPRLHVALLKNEELLRKGFFQ